MKPLPARTEEARVAAWKAVQGGRYGLTEDVFRALSELVDSVTNMDWRDAGAPDFGRDEWLAILDEGGKPIAAERRSVLPDTWVREQGGVWVVQRWLAHAVGFRHGVVHLILTPCAFEENVILQLRSFDKANAPGCFDVTLGGHIRAGTTPEETLEVELAEELGLDPKRDIVDLEFCGAYDFHGLGDDGEWANTEYRHVYRAALREGTLDRIVFEDGEVAGLLTMTREAAEHLMAAAPVHIASGLRESYTYFAQH